MDTSDYSNAASSVVSFFSDENDPRSARKALENEKELVEELTKKETRKVKIWRRNVFIVLGLTAALVTTMTYIFLRKQDGDDFDSSVRTP